MADWKESGLDYRKISAFVPDEVRKRILASAKEERRPSFMHQAGILIQEALDARDKKAKKP